MSILKRISPEEVAIAAKTVWFNQVIAKAISEETMDIILKTHKRKFSFFNGKTSRGLVGGLFYLLGYKYDVVKNQKELQIIWAQAMLPSELPTGVGWKSFPTCFKKL